MVEGVTSVLRTVESDHADDAVINDNDITTLEYSKRYSQYRLRITENELQEKSDILKQLLISSKEAFG